MEQVYLLLRNNHQTGPFTLEELVLLQLHPFDLVWVNGRSAAWQYPGEIKNLQPYMAILPTPEVPFKPISTASMDRYKEAERQIPKSPDKAIEKKIFVSLPASRTTPQVQEKNTYSDFSENQLFPSKAANPEKTSIAHRKNNVTEPAQLTFNSPGYSTPLQFQTAKKTTHAIHKNHLIIGGIALVIFTAGYFWMSKHSITTPDNKSHGNAVSYRRPVPELVEKNLVPPQPVLEAARMVKVINKEPSDRKKLHRSAPNNQVSYNNKQEIILTKPKPDSVPSAGKATVDVLPILKNQENHASVESVPKKKNIGATIKNIFAIKKRNHEEPTNKKQVLEATRETIGRTATRRENGTAGSSNTSSSDPTSSPVDKIPLTEQVEVSSNATDNWMLGIKDLKVTLRNKGNTVIQNATVQVDYLNDNNKLLEKKLLYFKEIKPYNRQTLSLPDHLMADHIELKLLAVSAPEIRTAAGN